MRITVHLDTFNQLDPSSYAILWLDEQLHRWSREGHMGLTLPEWGTVRIRQTDTMICGPHDTRPLCVLEGLGLAKHRAPCEGETGRAVWHGEKSALPAAGHWHVQCVDEDTRQAEHGVFSGEDA